MQVKCCQTYTFCILDLRKPSRGSAMSRMHWHANFETYAVYSERIGKILYASLKYRMAAGAAGIVSWIRKKDYHLLTVGLTTYSSDERFSATHLKHSEDWTLQIKFVQLRDAGVYECQVSTHPPTSIFLHLNVVEARAEISGPPIRYLTPGSTLRLQCRVVQNTEASEFIFWYHDNRMINYDIDRGINVSTDPDFQSSELTILRTRREHSGNFTCVASNTQPASILVHIFKGDNPAAMYHGHVGSSTKSYQTHLHSIMVIIALGYRIWHCYVHMKIV
ncbi:uncharacterized protein LOC119674041 [Teleopsis dalmanni]|uniref:uncharacterized protein LOC119674041 n=1 Tax=Teleopsis dalmanni TaxID=139649 RepID=UPI0018CC89EA|nr:uncharacterized protein LOC119674041 [Teleopsis dalmanni]